MVAEAALGPSQTGTGRARGTVGARPKQGQNTPHTAIVAASAVAGPFLALNRTLIRADDRGGKAGPAERDMSNTDSFIDEVNDEVRRDRLFVLLRKYGWIAVLAVVLLVAGATWNEIRKARLTAQAEALGDAIITALGENDGAARATRLSGVEADSAGGSAMLAFLLAHAEAEAGNRDAAIAALDSVAANADVPDIYQQMARFKSLTLQAVDGDTAAVRTGFASIGQPGSAFRVLAEEQLALLDIRDGNTDAALTRLQAIIDDAETTSDLQQRAAQLMVALGGEPRLPDPAING